MKPSFDVPPEWQPVLHGVLRSERSHALAGILENRESAGVPIYPPKPRRFRALELVSPDDIKAVILGQDPYHGQGQAHGLAFSVSPGIRIPPSLRNIFKELNHDLGIEPPVHGDLDSWARQGVLLLNTVLSVEDGKAGSHQGKGWEEITDEVIAHAGSQTSPAVFMLWGSHAQRKKPLINPGRHLILEAAHPSPLSAYRGFSGCSHFSKANAFLRQAGLAQVDWRLDPL
jgi:uracil-DNA glycosylase